MDISSKQRLLPELLPTILSFVPSHLSLRLVSKEWNFACEYIHSSRECTQCHGTGTIAYLIHGLPDALPWMRCWHFALNYEEILQFERDDMVVTAPAYPINCSIHLESPLIAANPKLSLRCLNLCPRIAQLMNADLQEVSGFWPLPLSWSDQSIGIKDFEAFVLSPHSRHISCLELDSIRTEALYCIRALSSSPCAAVLRSLSLVGLQGPQFHHWSQHLATPTSFPRLQHLKITDPEGNAAILPDTAIRSFLLQPLMQQLTSLTIDGAGLTSDILHRSPAARFQFCAPKLNRLFLESNALTDSFLHRLAANSNLPKLEYLDLSFNNDITAAGLRVLYQSPRLPALKFVDISFSDSIDPRELSAILDEQRPGREEFKFLFYDNGNDSESEDENDETDHDDDDDDVDDDDEFAQSVDDMDVI